MWIYWTPVNTTSISYSQLYSTLSADSVFKISTENMDKLYWVVDDSIVAYRDTNSSYPLKLYIREYMQHPIELEYLKVRKI